MEIILKNVIDEYTGKNNQHEDGIFLFSNWDKKSKIES